MELGAEMVDEVIIGEIVDEATFKADCAAIWMECMTAEGSPEDGGVTELSEFERRVREQYHDLFLEPEGLPPTRASGGFHIRTIPGIQPPHRSPYRQTAAEWEEYKNQTAELLEKRKIRSSHSPYAAPVLFVPIANSNLRMLIDYRALNNITIKDHFPLPHPEDLIACLQGIQCFSKMDFHRGYRQHRVHPGGQLERELLQGQVDHRRVVEAVGALVVGDPVVFLLRVALALDDPRQRILRQLLVGRLDRQHVAGVGRRSGTLERVGRLGEGRKCRPQSGLGHLPKLTNAAAHVQVEKRPQADQILPVVGHPVSYPPRNAETLNSLPRRRGANVAFSYCTLMSYVER